MKTNNLKTNGSPTQWQPARTTTVNPATPLPPDLTPDPLNRKLQSGQKLVGGASDNNDLPVQPYVGPNDYIPLEGYSSTDWQEDKSNQGNCTDNLGVNNSIATYRDIAVVRVNHQLCYRNLYIYLNAKPSGTNAGTPVANYMAQLGIEFWRGSSKLGFLPLVAAGGTGPSEHTSSITLYGGAATYNSVGLWLPDGTQQILQAHPVYSECDSIHASIYKIVAVESLFIYIGVASSKHNPQ